MMENTSDEPIGSSDTGCNHTYSIGDILANISDGPAKSFSSGASLFYILSLTTIAERCVGEWISKKERDGLKLHSIQFFKASPGFDREPIFYHEEIRLTQTGPILVLGFKEG